MTNQVDVSGGNGPEPQSATITPQVSGGNGPDPKAATVSPQVSGGNGPDPHPAHSVLNEMEDKLNTLGSFAYNELKFLIDRVRSLL